MNTIIQELERSIEKITLEIVNKLDNHDEDHYTEEEKIVAKIAFPEKYRYGWADADIYVMTFRGYQIANVYLKVWGQGEGKVEIYKGGELVKDNIFCSSETWAIMSAVLWIEANHIIDENASH